MALNDIVSKDLATRLSDVTESDLVVLVKALSLGFSPGDLHSAVSRIAHDEFVPLPTGFGAPRPLKINAWSFANDRGQYAGTYGLSDAEAGRLRGVLRDDPSTGVAEINAIVSKALQERGSNRPVSVSSEGMPGPPRIGNQPTPGRQGGADLKAEIAKNPSVYGMYDFDVVDTGRPGPYRFKVSLGSGLYAVSPSKRGAIDVARICRVKGRHEPIIAGRVVFWRDGKAPVADPDIPEKITFDGRLRPGEKQPAEPADKEKTTA